MTTDPPVYEDYCGYTLEVIAEADAICMRIDRPEGDGDGATCVDIAFADVRKVTAVMHAKAGLPDRWAELRTRLEHLRDLASGAVQGTPPTLVSERIAGRADGLEEALAVMGEIEGNPQP